MLDAKIWINQVTENRQAELAIPAGGSLQRATGTLKESECIHAKGSLKGLPYHVTDICLMAPSQRVLSGRHSGCNGLEEAFFFSLGFGLTWCIPAILSGIPHRALD
jgi:hypothetical protein